VDGNGSCPQEDGFTSMIEAMQAWIGDDRRILSLSLSTFIFSRNQAERTNSLIETV
jgi:hypothetical protein